MILLFSCRVIFDSEYWPYHDAIWIVFGFEVSL